MKKKRKTKRKASPAQLAARAKFAAIVRAKKGKRKPAKKVRRKKHVKRATPKKHKRRVKAGHYVAAVTRTGQEYFLSNDRLTTSRPAATCFPSEDAARKAGVKLARVLNRSTQAKKFVKIKTT